MISAHCRTVSPAHPRRKRLCVRGYTYTVFQTAYHCLCILYLSSVVSPHTLAASGYVYGVIHIPSSRRLVIVSVSTTNRRWYPRTPSPQAAMCPGLYIYRLPDGLSLSLYPLLIVGGIPRTPSPQAAMCTGLYIYRLPDGLSLSLYPLPIVWKTIFV